MIKPDQKNSIKFQFIQAKLSMLKCKLDKIKWD